MDFTIFFGKNNGTKEKTPPTSSVQIEACVVPRIPEQEGSVLKAMGTVRRRI